MLTTTPKTVNINRAAHLIGCTERRVRQMCIAGELAGAFKHGRSWRIPASAHPKLFGVRSPDDLTRELDMLDIPAHKKDAGLKRLGLIRDFEDYAAGMVRQGRTRTEARHLFCSAHKIGVRSLSRWLTLYRDQGLIGLIDTRGGAAFISQMISPDAFETFKAMYLTQQQLTIKTCWRNVCYINTSQGKGWKIPTYQTMVRHVTRQIPLAASVLHREGLAAYEAKCAPYIESDPDSVQPGQIWIGDHHQFNCFVRHRGKWIRPWVTGWEDMRSRMITGWYIPASPNQTTILQAMRRGIEKHGPPDSVKIDNGKDYDSEMWTGTTKQRRRALKAGYIDEQAVAGLYAMMDIGISFSKPYHPQSKAIERFFDTMDVQFIKTIETYAGKDTNRKPDDLAARLNDPRVIARAFTLETFAEAVGDYIEIYSQTAHTGRGMNGRAPAEVMATRQSRRVISDGVLDLLMRVWSGEVKVGKNGVRLKGMMYGQFAPELLIRQGQKCLLAYDPDDLRRVYVYDVATYRLITIAEQNQLIGYGAAVSEDALREASKQKSRALKLTKAYRDASLTAQMDLPTLTRRAMAEAAKADRRPAATAPAPTPTIRPAATPLDNQAAEHIRQVLRKTVRKAAGDKDTREVLDMDFTQLKPRRRSKVKLFDT